MFSSLVDSVRQWRRASSTWRAIEDSTAVVHVDLQGRIVTANARFCTLLGYSVDALRGQPESRVCPAGFTDSPAYRDLWEHLRSGQSVSGQVERLRRDGQRLWLRATCSPIHNRAGRVTHVVQTLQDITDQVNERIRATTLLEAIHRSMAVIEFDLQGRVRSANGNFLTTMGYDEPAVIGGSHSMFCPPGVAQSADYARFWQELRAGHFYRGQVERVDRNGRLVWLEATYNPVIGAHGKPTGVIKVATDITERVLQARARQEGVNTAYGIALGTQELSEQSAQTVGAAVVRIQSMAATVEDAARRSQALAQQTQAIGDVVATIRRVADQTNLLALNAAVEAARAGEAGRGFAVVAGEVRRLAADSKAATEQISQSVRAIQEEVRAMRSTMDGGLASVDEGVALARQALQSMDRIRQDAGQVVGAVQALHDHTGS